MQYFLNQPVFIPHLPLVFLKNPAHAFKKKRKTQPSRLWNNVLFMCSMWKSCERENTLLKQHTMLPYFTETLDNVFIVDFTVTC